MDPKGRCSGEPWLGLLRLCTCGIENQRRPRMPVSPRRYGSADGKARRVLRSCKRASLWAKFWGRPDRASCVRRAECGSTKDKIRLHSENGETWSNSLPFGGAWRYFPHASWHVNPRSEAAGRRMIQIDLQWKVQMLHWRSVNACNTTPNNLIHRRHPSSRPAFLPGLSSGRSSPA